jgi:hypothetical protein
MATIRQWTKDGTLVQRISTMGLAQFNNGRICHLGSGHFLGCNRGDDSLDQFHIDGVTASKVKDHFGFTGANQQGWGVCCLGQNCVTERGHDQSSVQIATLESDTNMGLAFAFVRAYDLESGALLHGFPYQALVSLGGITTDGYYVYFTYENAAAFNLLAKIELRSNGFGQIGLWLFTPLAEDICYDGKYLWAIQGSNVTQWIQDGNTTPKQVRSWALTGGTAMGIATDGNYIYTMARA